MDRMTDAARPSIILVTGPVNGGKTTYAESFARGLLAEGRSVRGVLSRAAYRGTEKVSYSFEEFPAGAREPYAVRKTDNRASGEGGRGDEPRGERSGSLETDTGRSGAFRRWEFLETGFRFAEEALERSAGAEFVLVDEIGPLELGGGGLRGAVERLVRARDCTPVLTVRDSLLDPLCALLEELGAAPDTVRIIRVGP